MTHEEISELVAAYALDAVVGDERRDVELHLEACPRCRSELDVYRDVAAALGNSVAPLPEGVWLGIAGGLAQGEDEPTTVPRLFAEPVGGASVVAHRRRRRLSSRSGFAVVGCVVGAAAAAAAILGFGLIRSNDEVSRLQAAPAPQPSSVVAALEAPGHKVVNLGDGGSRTLAQFVLADGRGYLVSSALPALKSSETYQLWGLVNGQPISLGLLGQSPSNSVFTVAGSEAPSQLRITVEPSGGSVVPSGSLVASGLV
jgi:anti-sigma-K factor RskA